MRLPLHSFRTKLLGSFLVCSLVPLLLCSILLVHITRLQLDAHTRAELQEQITAITQAMDLVSDGMAAAAHRLSQNQTITHALMGQPVPPTAVTSHLFLATDPIRGYASFSVYDLEGRLLCSTDSHPVQTSLPISWGILHAVQNGDASPVFQVNTQPSDIHRPLLQGAVPLTTGGGRSIGYLVMEMGQPDFWSLFEGKYRTQDELLIVNSFWHPVFASNNELLTTKASQFRAQLFRGDAPTITSENYLYEIAQHEPTGLLVFLQKPQIFNSSATKALYAISLSCALLCVVISVLLYIPLSKQISSPIRRLQKAFERLERDDLSVQIPVDRRDEIGQLAKAFNLMVHALKQNRQELLENQQELNEAQIRLLQAQLNPHFLCNTLDTMKWMGKINQVPEIAEMSANLADILRYCIIPEELVPLYREIDFLERYVEIQKIRMGDQFDFQVELPEELGMCMVPKMILQPIVENAIIHGLPGVSNRRIHVSIYTKGELLQIAVTDNGCGLPDHLVGKPYTRSPAPDGKHLGLYNVDTILAKHYGAGCGLYLNRGPDGTGTSVIATLPIQKEAYHP